MQHSTFINTDERPYTILLNKRKYDLFDVDFAASSGCTGCLNAVKRAINSAYNFCADRIIRAIESQRLRTPTPDEIKFPPHEKLKIRFLSGQRLEKSDHRWPDLIFSILLDCWKENPSDRIQAETLTYKFNQILKNEKEFYVTEVEYQMDILQRNEKNSEYQKNLKSFKNQGPLRGRKIKPGINRKASNMFNERFSNWMDIQGWFWIVFGLVVCLVLHFIIFGTWLPDFGLL